MTRNTHDHTPRRDHGHHADHRGGHGGHDGDQDSEHKHHVDHTGHEEMFRNRFWVSLILSVPVVLYDPMIHQWLDFTMPAFPGTQWITPMFAILVFFYGGLPFLQMASPELRNRQPGMMMLISLAITVAFGYSVTTVDARDENDLLALAAAIEGDSEHTIARGIRRAADERKLTLPRITGFEAIKGRGVKAERDGSVVLLGGPRLLELLEMDLPEPLPAFRKETDEKGQTAVYLIQEKRAIGGIALADVIRSESRQAVRQLHTMGIEVAMLTGDSEAVARAVSEEVGIDQYFAEVLPEHKDQKVVDLQRRGKKVAMVGGRI